MSWIVVLTSVAAVAAGVALLLWKTGSPDALAEEREAELLLQRAVARRR